MKKKKAQHIGLRGDAKVSLQLVPQHLKEARGAAGPGIDPSGLPRSVAPSGSPGSSSS